MGIQDRDYYRETTRGLGILGERMHACLGLSAVFVVVFFIQIGTRDEVGFPRRDAGTFTEALQLDTTKVLSGEVWRVFTSAFLHDIGRNNSLLSRLLPIALSLFFLNWFGRHVEDIYGWQEFLGYCLSAALWSGIGLVAGAAITQQPIKHIGPSGMITAVLLLYALHYPHRTIMLFFVVPIPVWAFVGFYAVLDVIGFVDGRVHPAIIFSHLFCAGFALLYYRYSLRVSNWIPAFSRRRSKAGTASPRSKLFGNTPDTDRIADPDVPPPRTQPSRVTPVMAEVVRETNDEKMDAKLESQMDAVLEKMNKYGRESLTEEEWAILRRASEVCQKRRRSPD